MFQPSSRYAAVDRATITTRDNRQISYVRRRFLPQGDLLSLLVQVVVMEGDRLDQITARTLGDPEQFWRVCDANNAMNPVDLVSTPGQTLRVPVPHVEG